MKLSAVSKRRAQASPRRAHQSGARLWAAPARNDIISCAGGASAAVGRHFSRPLARSRRENNLRCVALVKYRRPYHIGVAAWRDGFGAAK